VHDALARQTRVCAYDRAGFGFSGAGTLPRNLDAQVADLHALIDAAKLATPLVLVGHSLGSNIVRGFAQRHPQQVAALVLVDPPEHGADARMPADWQAQVAAMVVQRGVVLDRCEAAAEAGDSETLTQACLRAPPPWMGPEVAAAVARNKSRPAYWQMLRSELASSAEMYAAPVPEGESYGAIPLVLLSAAGDDGEVPQAVRDVTAAAQRETRERILAASTRSTHVEVADSSHDIQLDQPEAVVSAISPLLGSSPANSE
jgi:pimeloyl-ACP methyl ester carboxylesterase